MSDEAQPEVKPSPPQRTLIPEGAVITIKGKEFRLEMRTVVSGTKEDIEAAGLKQLT